MADICATEMVPRFRTLDPGEIFEKGPGDLVTVVDRHCEALLQERLGAILPQAGFVGEEAASADPGVLDRIADPGPVWVVDPLDGTGNFAAGRDEFGMIVALLVDGRTEAGWIHLPIAGESFFAVRGQGAFDGDGTPLRTAPDRPWAEQYGLFNIPSATKQPAAAAGLRALKGDLGRYGPSRCSAYAYSRIASGGLGASGGATASGGLDFAIYRNLKPWDHAAGVLMVGEAGGASANLGTGNPYAPTDKAGPLAVTSGEETLARLRDRLSG